MSLSKLKAQGIEPGASGGIPSGFYASKSLTQTIPAAADTKLIFDVENYDLGNEYDPVTNYRFTAANAGKYLFTYSAAFDNLADTKNFHIKIDYNGTQIHLQSMSNSGYAVTQAMLAAIVSLSAGDFVEFAIRNNDTVSRIVRQEPIFCFVQGQRLY